MRPILKHPLQHWNERPEGVSVDTIVIHSLFAVECADPLDTEACIKALDDHSVAAHYIISRSGEITGLVEESRRAWHAGESRMPFEDDSREVVNDFSIGVELVGSKDSGFTEEQYDALAELVTDIMSRHSVRSVVGHEHIAPSRKEDPGPTFKWSRLLDGLRRSGLDTNTLRFDVRCRATED